MHTDPLIPLRNELQRLDLLLHREILRLRAGYALSLDEFRGLYVSDEHVDALVEQSLRRDGPDVAALTERAESLRREHAAHLPPNAPWARLAVTFGLSRFEQDVLLLALAPEIDLKYETLYAYLNNDVSRRWPTFDLALRLFSDARGRARAQLVPEATLLRRGLLRTLASEDAHPSWLATGFTASPLVARFALGLDVWNVRLAPFARHEASAPPWSALPLPDALIAALQRTAERYREPAQTPPLLVFEGRRGAKRAQAAGTLCRTLGRSLLRLDAGTLRTADELSETLQALALQQHLTPAGLYVERVEALFDKEGRPVPEAWSIIEHVTRVPGPVVLACEPKTPWRALLGEARSLAFRFGEPDAEQRRRLWSRALAEDRDGVPADKLQALAEHFVLNPGQIARAATAARDQQWERGERGLSPDILFEAARAESGSQLGRLATKVERSHDWSDLVLPPTTLQRIREIAAAVRHRHLVYAQWGFGRRIVGGRGLKVLFTGTPGTGKTMTAGVIARDLGLDLYKVDLSGVVSKYIGETEKNLDRIFRAAHASNAILFFDEADALFGKRSEVSDAHDRYANIETSYLLQKMEEHEGTVILATNLRKNIDEAFSRRMHYVVEFPMPDERHREHLWRGMFPPEAPLGDDVDLGFMARQFTLSGGDIQNVVLDAAFLAAQNGKVVAMEHLVNAMARQMSKQGQLLSPQDFKQYNTLIGRGR